jgi:uncharacterized membrane protein YqhA
VRAGSVAVGGIAEARAADGAAIWVGVHVRIVAGARRVGDDRRDDLSTVGYDRTTMIRDILGTSRYLIILAVLGTFIASATLQVFGLLRVAAVIIDLVRAGDVSSAASKALIANTVAIIDIFLIGTVLFVISAGLYQLFVQRDVQLPTWLKIESLDDLKDNLTEVIIVALLVAFLGQAIEWTGGFEILGFGIAIGAVIVAVGVLTWATRARRPRAPD